MIFSTALLPLVSALLSTSTPSIVGHWGIQFFFEADFRFSADGQMEKISSFDGEVLGHLKYHYVADEAVSPHRLEATVTEILIGEPDEENTPDVGGKVLCIYGTAGDWLKLACNMEQNGYPLDYEEGDHFKGDLFRLAD